MFCQKSRRGPVVSPAVKRHICQYLQEAYQISIRKACSLVHFCRSMWYYQSQGDDSKVIEKLEELAGQFPTRGFDNYYGRLRQQGYSRNRKKCYEFIGS